jgi:hypothetical protein
MYCVYLGTQCGCYDNRMGFPCRQAIIRFAIPSSLLFLILVPSLPRLRRCVLYIVLCALKMSKHREYKMYKCNSAVHTPKARLQSKPKAV